MKIEICKHGTIINRYIGNPPFWGETYICKDCEIENLKLNNQQDEELESLFNEALEMTVKSIEINK